MAVQPAYRDAERTNDSPRSVRIYKDLNLNFGIHPVTKQINTLTDASAVKRSVRNLVQYGFYEKPFHPEIGSGIRSILFQPMSPITAYVLSRKVEEVIENFEPRVKLVGVRAIPDLDRNSYEVTIEFYVLNAPTELAELTVLLERSR